MNSERLIPHAHEITESQVDVLFKEWNKRFIGREKELKREQEKLNEAR